MRGKFVELLCITLGSHSVAELAKVGLEDCTAVLIYISNQVSPGGAWPYPSRCDQFQHKISFDQKYNQRNFSGIFNWKSFAFLLVRPSQYQQNACLQDFSLDLSSIGI